MLAERDKEPPVDGLQFYLEAFRELGTTRQIGMGTGPIPFTSIVQYSTIYDVGDFEEFLYIIREMDKKFLESVNKEVRVGTRGKDNKGSAVSKR